MRLLYNIGIFIYSLLIRLFALFNTKASLFVKGRKNIFERIKFKIDGNQRPIWFHFASLGEFEQGRPVLEKLKTTNPSQPIVVTFFSPSGYEIRKDYAMADVFYLPLDTPGNAKEFVKIVNPKIAIFTKYEFWFNYFNELHKRQIPLYLISGIFRPNQIFFKWYGNFYRSLLKFVSHFFVQNEESISLLKSIGINEASLSGDTRFDRVFENAQHPKKLKVVEDFIGNSNVFIAGSTWPEDEILLASLIEKYPGWKLVIAPHEVDKDHITDIEKLFPTAVKFSVLNSQSGGESGKTKVQSLPNTDHGAQTLIIDNIGMLSSLYQYGKVAYIGGGFGTGIHNTLEAAAFGLPIIFGPKYDKFQEAKDLIKIGAAKSINSAEGLIDAFNAFRSDEKAGTAAKNYVEDQKGATEMILKSIKL